jgi:hypothetical protein
MIEIALPPAPQRRPFTSSFPLTIGQRLWPASHDVHPTCCNRRRRAKNHPGPRPSPLPATRQPLETRRIHLSGPSMSDRGTPQSP